MTTPHLDVQDSHNNPEESNDASSPVEDRSGETTTNPEKLISESIADEKSVLGNNDVPNEPELSPVADVSSESSGQSKAETLIDNEILRRIEAISESFNERSRAQEETIRNMHRRIEELQEDQVRTLLKPIFERLAGLHAQSAEGAEEARAETLNQSNTIKIFEQFKDSIEDLLSMLDIESVGATVGELVDRKKHYAVKIKKTSDKSLDKTIYKIQRQGFTFVGADRVMLPARVIAYKYDASLDVPEQPYPVQSELPHPVTSQPALSVSEETPIIP